MSSIPFIVRLFLLVLFLKELIAMDSDKLSSIRSQLNDFDKDGENINKHLYHHFAADYRSNAFKDFVGDQPILIYLHIYGAKMFGNHVGSYFEVQ